MLSTKRKRLIGSSSAEFVQGIRSAVVSACWRQWAGRDHGSREADTRPID